MNLLIYGLITGIIFGFLMQKARVLRYDKQLAALRFLDMTIVKFMLSCVLVGIVGLYLLNNLGVIQFKIKATVLGANIIGGLIFGMGWGLLGYCPGTQLGAVGEGRHDAAWGILGMLVGGFLYALSYPFFKKTVLTWGDLGKVTLPQVTNLSPWIIIPILIIATIFLFRFFEKRGL